MDIEIISPSQYSTYDWCEWKWALQYDLKFKDFAGHSALAGTIAHDVLEVLSNARIAKRDPASKLWNHDLLFEWAFNNHTSNDKINGPKLIKDKKKIKDVKAGIEWLLAGSHSPKTANTIHAEHEFCIEFKSPEWSIGVMPDGTTKYFKFRGKIDRLDDHGGGVLEIVDYKSGKRSNWPPGKSENQRKEVEDFYNDIQCLGYYYAAKELYPEAKSILVTFIFIVDKSHVTLSLTDVDIERFKNKLLNRLLHIKQNNNPTRSQSWACKHICSFGDKTGICNKVWKEKENLGFDFVSLYYKGLNLSQREKNEK